MKTDDKTKTGENALKAECDSVQRLVMHVNKGSYESMCGITIIRDSTKSGRWIMRDSNGTRVDSDRYINDLASRHSLILA